MPLSAGEKLGPYEILAPIGAGGMGAVYRARDSRLNRNVAIKVSDAQFTERFEREAKSIAALNHPNICQIYDVGPNYIVMECIDGAPVVAHDALEEPLPPAEALRLAIQIASALEAAHAKGIIHRDLKPANILATRNGTVKLLDFGLAKQSNVGASTEETQSLGTTQPGTIMGTPAYMSPEQAEGRPADARSDIFSFGAVLYEMLAGRRAFPGNSAAAVIGAIVHVNPAPLKTPPAIASIVNKCLAKPPDNRFQSATDLRVALEAASTSGSAKISKRTIVIALAAVALVAIVLAAAAFYLKSRKSAQIDSIAVLPLENRSSDPTADYISDGIMESVNNSLARLPGLRVVPHSVAFHYKGKPIDVQKIGEELGVRSVLAGQVAHQGDNVTIDIELDDVRDGKQLWGEQYNRKSSDLLSVQNEIAKEVSQRLRSQLTAADQQKLTKGSTNNPEAYSLYLKGKHYTNEFTKDGFAKGLDYFNQAIALDPNYGLAYNGLAYNYINQDGWFLPARVAGPKARAAAEKALAIDESDADAHLTLAIEMQWYEWDWAASEKEFKRAIELNPNNSEAYTYYSWFLAPMGRNDEAVAVAKRGLQADPLSPLANFNLGAVYVFLRQWDDAITQLRSAKELDSSYWFNYCYLGRAYEQKGKLPEAIAEFQHGISLEKENTEIWSGLGHAYAISGKKAEAQKVLDHLQEVSAHSYVSAYAIAVIYAGLGDKDKAFEWLDKAYDDRSYFVANYLTTDARLDPLRVDPRFDALRRRVGLP